MVALPLASITSFVGIVLVIVSFVTSSDSGSLVIGTITLLLGGGLGAPRAMAVSKGFSRAVVLPLARVAMGPWPDDRTPGGRQGRLLTLRSSKGGSAQ